MNPGRAAAVLLLLVALLPSCAALKAPQDADTAAAKSGAAPAAVQVEVAAPPALKTLLERHLDLARLRTLARGEAIGEVELARLIDATPAQARALLETEGLFDARVAVERSDGADGVPRVRVRVEPGAPTRIGRVDLEIQGDLERAAAAGDAAARALIADLRRGWPLPAGAPFRNAAWADAKTATLGRLRAAGYATAGWSGTAADIDVAAHSARLFLVADSGPLFRSGELRVEGLILQERATVENLANFRAGTPVTETLLLDFQERLVKSGLFDHVAVTLEADPAQAAAAPIVVRLSEQARRQLTTGVGISANAGPRLTLEGIERRLLGYAATGRGKLEWGRDRQAFDGEVSSHARPGLFRNVVGLTLERLKTDDDTVLSQRLRAGRAQETPRTERFYFAEYLRDTRRTDLTRSETNALTLNGHGVWRRIDNPLLPTDGWTLSLQAAVGRSGGTVEGRGLFGRLYGRATVYRPLGSTWYGQARLELGQILGPGSGAAPETLAFRAGGDDSVRGYAYRTLGPLDGDAVGSGRVLLTASVEAARPLLASMPSLWGAVFVDAGQAADRWGDLKPVVGSGVGLRWRSPVGPLKLDLAYGHELRRMRLHFSVGIVF